MATADTSTLNVINTFANIAIPILILFGGYLLNRRRQIMERADKHRIQLDIEADTFGPQQGNYLVELVVTLDNKGMTRMEIDNINLEVLGICNGENINLLDESDEDNQKKLKAEFPKILVKANMLQPNENNISGVKKEISKVKYFVEPSVNQRFSYVVRIPEVIRFILFRVSFKYQKNSEHSAQRVFELN